jgi:hypothetical protein
VTVVDDDVHPEWVTLGTLVSCIILAARLNHGVALDEAGARRLTQRIADILSDDPDNTLDSRRPFAFWTDDGAWFEDIDYLEPYRKDWQTWDLILTEGPPWPKWIGVQGHLAVRWYKFDQAVAQALRHAPQAVTSVAQAAGQVGLHTGAAPLTHEQVTDPVDDLPQAREVGSEAPLLQVQLHAGEVLESPLDWPQLPQPTPGEPIAAYAERVIFGDPFFQELEERCVRAGLGRWRLSLLRPATLTLEWWETRYSNRRFVLPWAAAFPDQWRMELRKARETSAWRLVVSMFEPLRTGEVRAEGQRIDVVRDSPEVARELWSNPNMALLPSGEFRPQSRWGQALPSFIGLTLWPAKATETKQKAPPRVPFQKLLGWWTKEYLPRYPDPDKRPNVAKQQNDAAAAFPDHAPPTARTMQHLRANKATPPEWRDVGRRPTSD